MRMNELSPAEIYAKIGLRAPPLPWHLQIEYSRSTKSKYSFEEFNSQQHKTRLQTFQRRTGVVHDASAVKSQVKHVRRTRSADKSRSRQNGEVEEEDESDFVDSWRFNTAQKEIGEEEERLFLLQRAEIEFLEYRKCQSLTASPAHTHNGLECSTPRNNSIGTETVQKPKKRGPLNFRPFKKSVRKQQLC
ncbi:Oidioi.mRNA.OKI2018_I69.chr2.g6956.t1.cds [Oikopleura dioica]|uniref:Oidioi.mRNA.OKI2018_I69.chr2.g6956.t1.cds n=1 Tax=Oikopleura dioica TaxID=34765 RepID=A0ABN7T9F9_OIKDI|nr:Oidioi.mRNA.OKI2018_I69.chr2.g6956.t1.cds [Oikopleura dioica]